MLRPSVSYLSKEIPQQRPKESNQECAEAQRDKHFINYNAHCERRTPQGKAAFRETEAQWDVADEGRFPTTRQLSRSSKSLYLFSVLKS